MATPGLSAVSSDTPEDRQDSSGVAVQPKYTKSASGALIPTASTVLSSPEEQGSILENMKNYVKQREAQQNSLLTADRKSTRLNSSHIPLSRMPSSA